LRNLLYWVWLCILVSWPSSLRAVDCSTDTVGLCSPTIEEIIDETSTETVQYEADGYTVTTETITNTTTTTVANEDSDDILDGDNDYVSSSRYEGDMDLDWGGQGSANMPSGSGCYNLGTDKCAQITGSGNSTSTMGVSGMGTTFINTVDISDLDITHGGKTNYTIKVDKQDAQDRIYMHITGKNGNTLVFSGTDILSESGVASGYQAYEGGFDFAGTLTTLVIEVGGRDINLAIGPLFDDVTVNILYNTINTIVQQSITSVEMWVAYGGSTETETITIVENIFDNNDVMETPEGDMYFEPEFDEPDMNMSYETVEMEMEMDFEFDMPDLEMPEMEMEMEIATVEMEMEMEMSMEMDLEMEMEMPDMEMEMDMPEIEMAEMDMEMPEPEMEVEAEPTTEPEPEMEEPINEPETEAEPEPTDEPTDEPKEEVAEEPEAEESAPEATEDESEDDVEEVEDKGEDEEKPVKKPESKKEKAAKKIVKKMGDKGRYDSQNQLKTLIVMQVLGNTKTFFDTQQQLNDRAGFFSDESLPDAFISDNNIASYFLFAGSDGLMNEMVMQQWQK